MPEQNRQGGITDNGSYTQQPNVISTIEGSKKC